MKKAILALVATLSMQAADTNLYNYSFSFMGGYSLNSSESNLENGNAIGIRYGYARNTKPNSIDPDVVQFTMDYSRDIRYTKTTGRTADLDTGIFRFGVNTMWYIENDTDVTPYVLAGVGMQIFTEDKPEMDNAMPFVTIGAGAEYQIRGDFSAMVELKAMYDGDNGRYIVGMAGFKYSFGQNYASSGVSTQRSAAMKYISGR